MSKEKNTFSRRSAARYAAIQALHQFHLRGESAPSMMHEFEAHFINHHPHEEEDLDLRHADRGLFTFLFEGVVSESEDLKAIITPHLGEGWTFDRVEPILRWILLLGTYELLRSGHIPAAVILNEYIEATKDFVDLKEASFVNGVLDKVVKKIKI